MSSSYSPADRPRLPVVARPVDEPAKDFAYRYIKELILDLTLPPGHIVTEMDIATVTGLSRTPVREAFLRLDAERLIQLIPRRGALVTTVTARQIRELSKTRLILELHAVGEIVANRIQVADTLFPLVDKQAELFADGVGFRELVAVDRAFHTAIVAAVGNTEMTELYKSMGDRQMRTGVTSFTSIPGRAESAVPHHRRIAEALQRFDLADAENALRDHLERNAPDLERYLP